MKNKKWYLSKTVWGIICTAITYLLQSQGVAIPNEVYAATVGLTGIGFRDAMKE